MDINRNRYIFILTNNGQRGKKGGEDSVDYKKMYLTAMDAMERAIELLAAAQQECENIYVASDDQETEPFSADTGHSGEK